MISTDYTRDILETRAREQLALKRFPSVLFAVERRPLPIGDELRFAGVAIVATPEGFLVNGEASGPRTVDAGRYALRLSHQGYPALVVLDREATTRDAHLRWFDVDPSLRVSGRIEPDESRIRIASTASPLRAAERVGWFTFAVAGVDHRLAVTRLMEPGVPDDQLDIYFRDATTGRESYDVGRYVTVEREGGQAIVDFNLAYNPSCSLSPYYNCPIPPAENHLKIPIRAGEMTPLVDQAPH